MQEQKVSKIRKWVKKLGLWNMIFLTMFAGVAVVALGVVLYTYRKLPLASHRESTTGFPIQAIGIKVEAVEAEWKSSKGNARLELRTAYYPSATIRLAPGNGSGVMLVRFLNHRQEMVGELFSIPYRDGQFVRRDDVNIKSEGLSANVIMEGGYADRDSYLLHCLNEQEHLWRVCIWQQPEGAGNVVYLGYKTVTATPAQ